MAERKDEQIAAAVAAHLRGIVGDGGAAYWYAPDAVLRAPAFHEGCLNPLHSTIYILSPTPGPTLTDQRADSCSVKAILSLDLAVARRFTTSEADSFQLGEPTRWTEQTRIAGDAKKRLRSDPDDKLGGSLVQTIDVPTTDFGSPETYLEGWAVVFMRVLIRYHYPKATP